MTKKKKPQSYSTDNMGIQAKNIRAKSIAIGKGATAVVTENTPNAKGEIEIVFEMLNRKANSLRDETQRHDTHHALNALENEARQGKKTQEKTVQKWLNFLLETSPDIWEVVVDTFTNPIKGVSTVFRKVAARAKSGQDSNINN